MNRFIVFDVETPNHLNDRMSAIGITIVEDGVITDEFYSLVNPEVPFDGFNIDLTGIDEDLVRDAPTFPVLWQTIEPTLASGLLVAHNAVFDMGVLKKCLNFYDINWHDYVRYLCTVQVGRHFLPGMKRNLNVLCAYYGISLDHHQAASDSRACAQILLRYIESGFDVESHIRTFSFSKNLKLIPCTK